MISFVYFDVGGVLMRDFTASDKWTELKRELGISPRQDKDFERFYKGHEREISLDKEVDDLMPLIENEFGIQVPEDYSFLRDGFLKRFEANEHIRPVLKKVRGKYRTGLLTNMFVGMLDLIREKGILPEEDWEIVVDSTVDKVKKPDREIFELAGKKAGVADTEILFVDNTRENIEAAEAYGWQTFWYDSGDYEGSSEKLDRFLE